mmetsp:Transcript_61187/g.137876  ORF Transcript_61187/g.137876 Transcript_61187/m.137876 type:complete len:201 (-) Transcript_61187:107-709(-)
MAFTEPARNQLNDKIRAAQLEAGIKRPHSTFNKPRQLNDRIRAAQDLAGIRGPSALERPASPKTPESEGSAPECSKVPEDFMGKWRDTYGNTVCVYSTDAFESRPMATLSRAPRPDIHLKLIPRDGTWQCGDAVLDTSRCSDTSVAWLFPNGKVSVWTRWHEGAEEDDKVFANLEPMMPQHRGYMLPQFLMPIGLVQLSC